MKKSRKSGYVLQMIYAIAMLVYSCLIIVAGIIAGELQVLDYPAFYLGVLATIAVNVLIIIFVILGKKHIWSNVLILIGTALPILAGCVSIIRLLLF